VAFPQQRLLRRQSSPSARHAHPPGSLRYRSGSKLRAGYEL